MVVNEFCVMLTVRSRCSMCRICALDLESSSSYMGQISKCVCVRGLSNAAVDNLMYLYPWMSNLLKVVGNR